MPPHLSIMLIELLFFVLAVVFEITFIDGSNSIVQRLETHSSLNEYCPTPAAKLGWARLSSGERAKNEDDKGLKNSPHKRIERKNIKNEIEQ